MGYPVQPGQANAQHQSGQNAWSFNPKTAPAMPIKPYVHKDWCLTDKKVSKELKSFDGIAANDKQCHTRVRDHCHMFNPDWRRLLNLVEKSHAPITWAYMGISKIDALRPQDLVAIAHDLWAFLGSVMTDAIHPRRQALAAGEDGNGLELWRALYYQYEGGSVQVHLQGIRSFHSSPQCKRLQDLNVHIGQWIMARSQHANSTPPEHLKYLLRFKSP